MTIAATDHSPCCEPARAATSAGDGEGIERLDRA